jgi:hypothetical protein
MKKNTLARQGKLSGMDMRKFILLYARATSDSYRIAKISCTDTKGSSHEKLVSTVAKQIHRTSTHGDKFAGAGV